jgi:hypothetical protein
MESAVVRADLASASPVTVRGSAYVLSAGAVTSPV